MKLIQFRGNEYFDDRMFILEITPVTINEYDFSESREAWSVITRKNTPGYFPTRADDFESKEKALEFYKEILPHTPLISMRGKPLEPILVYESYVSFFKKNGIDVTPFSNQT